jgi:beta-aspartyl-dipeptidase (metallo-type)
MSPYFTLIRGAEVYAPEALGRQDVLLAGERVLKIGDITQEQVAALGVGYEVVDATGLVLTPGLVDSHQHPIGGGGEQGFGSRTPPVEAPDLVRNGVTTLVGCIGTDTTARSLTDLLGKVRQLHEAGVSAYMLTGGYPVPTPVITANVQDDVVLIPEIIGAGELAISDVRSVEPPPPELAKVVAQAMIGGSLGGKGGVTQFHVGVAPKRLACLRTLVDVMNVPANQLYVLHINRSEALQLEAIDLAKRGAWVDTDTVDEDAPAVLRFYKEHGGPPDKLSFSSDYGAAGGEVRKLWRMFRSCVRDHGYSLEETLPHFTSNPADALRLAQKGWIKEGGDADLLALEPGSLEIVHVFARGRALVRDGRLVK